MFYAIVIVSALVIFAIGVAKLRAHTLTDSYPTPSVLTISVFVIYIFVEAAKLLWVPLRALTSDEVGTRRSRYDKFIGAVLFVIISAFLLEKCGL